MKYTLIVIALLALEWDIKGNPVAEQVRSIRKARQTSFEPLFGGSSHFGYPFVGGRLSHQGNGWDANAQGKVDLGGNWEAGGGLGVGSNGWRLGVDGTYRSDNSWELGSRLSYDKGNVGAFLSGNVNSDGGYGIGAGLKIRFKRDAQFGNGRFNVTIRADPCNFNAYDLNQDGVITTFEFQTIFGSDESTRNLFNALDITTVDGILIRDEFEAMAERVIEECEPLSE